jgi:transcriptional regulator with XRE-family HTH domain
MSIRERAAQRGARRGQWLRGRLADGLATARRASGLSLREVGRRLGVGHDRVARAERGDPIALTIDFAAQTAAVLGLELGLSLHPDGDPVRDKGHLALLARFRSRLDPGLGWRTEVAKPIVGDRRSADAVITGLGFGVLIEAETHLDDVQALERSIAGKQRDVGIDRVVLLVSDTRHNREVIGRVAELRRRFPVETRPCLQALRRGGDPGGDALVIL